jgi:hypothetical protein
MKKRWIQFGVLALAAAISLAGIAAGGGFAVFAAETCPDGGGWTKIDSGDLSAYPVAGASEYCFKAGQFTSSSIPEGGFGQEGSCNDGIQYCELSHWSYFIEEPTNTPPPPTETPEPTPTDTPEEPTPTPTDTPEGPTPTPTDTPTEPTPTPTATKPPRREPTPTELPKTGFTLDGESILPGDLARPWEWSQDVWLYEGYPNLFLTHNGSDTAGFGDELVMLQRNDVFTFGPHDYEVTGIMRVAANDTWVMDTIASYDGTVFMTCSGYNSLQDYWAYRVIVFMEQLP